MLIWKICLEGMVRRSVTVRILRTVRISKEVRRRCKKYKNNENIKSYNLMIFNGYFVKMLKKCQPTTVTNEILPIHSSAAGPIFVNFFYKYSRICSQKQVLLCKHCGNHFQRTLNIIFDWLVANYTVQNISVFVFLVGKHEKTLREDFVSTRQGPSIIITSAFFRVYQTPSHLRSYPLFL